MIVKSFCWIHLLRWFSEYKTSLWRTTQRLWFQLVLRSIHNGHYPPAATRPQSGKMAEMMALCLHLHPLNKSNSALNEMKGRIVIGRWLFVLRMHFLSKSVVYVRGLLIKPWIQLHKLVDTAVLAKKDTL